MIDCNRNALLLEYAAKLDELGLQALTTSSARLGGQIGQASCRLQGCRSSSCSNYVGKRQVESRCRGVELWGRCGRSVALDLSETMDEVKKKRTVLELDGRERGNEVPVQGCKL